MDTHTHTEREKKSYENVMPFLVHYLVPVSKNSYQLFVYFCAERVNFHFCFGIFRHMYYEGNFELMKAFSR